MKTWPEGWQSLVESSVSPLAHGTRPLDVMGLRPPVEQQRPGRTAAVLVGILERDQPEIVLTRRARHLTQHAGQVSFPGGAAEGRGETAVDTALREAEEEIGLAPADVRPLGFLDRVDTISDFRVLPVVALLSHSGPWTLDHREVDQVFTIPLNVATNRDAWSQREIEHEGERRLIYSMDWSGHTIWGITATILVNFARRLENTWASEDWSAPTS